MNERSPSPATSSRATLVLSIYALPLQEMALGREAAWLSGMGVAHGPVGTSASTQGRWPVRPRVLCRSEGALLKLRVENIRKLLGHACTHYADLQRACTPSAIRSYPSYALHTNSACTLAHGAIAAGTRGEASTDSVRWHRSYELRDICRAMQNPCALAAHLAPRRLLGRRPGLQPRGADTSGRGQFHFPRPWRPTVIVAESTLRSNA